MAHSVLIIKLAAIGDVVMALPMVTALRAAHPDARIAWMCGAAVAPLLACVDGIDEVIAVDETSMLVGSPLRKASAVAGAWRKIAARRFDAVYVAHSDARYRVLALPQRSAERRWLGGRTRARGIVAGRCHPDEYARLVTGHDDHRARSFAFPPFRTTLTPSLGQRLAAYAGGRPLIAMSPGGARNVARENPLRRWPLERYAALADALLAHGFGVLLTGSRTDGWIRPPFFDRGVLDLIGATDLPALVATLARCAVVVAHDSGPLHLARLAGRPVVALLGPTAPSMFFRPEARTAVLWPAASLACAPCYDGYDFAPCEDNLCMKAISVDAVLQEVLAFAPGRSAVPPTAGDSSTPPVPAQHADPRS